MVQLPFDAGSPAAPRPATTIANATNSVTASARTARERGKLTSLSRAFAFDRPADLLDLDGCEHAVAH
jgi:hypothetical protein